MARKGAGASITAELTQHTFHGHSKLTFTRDLNSLPAKMVCFITLHIVTLHIDKSHAARTGLFGKLAEERVKLVDARNHNKIQQYHALWASGPQDDTEPMKSFAGAMTPAAFVGRLNNWREHLNLTWTRRMSMNAEEKNPAELDPCEQVWELEKGKPVNPYGLGMPLDVLKIDHPWVRKTLEEMPRFEPQIMFRLCTLNCYRPKLEAS